MENDFPLQTSPHPLLRLSCFGAEGRIFEATVRFPYGGFVFGEKRSGDAAHALANALWL